MRDDELRRNLTVANPWWRAAASRSDPVVAVTDLRLLRERARHDLGYRTDVLDDLATSELGDPLVLVTGPRRVGKSVALLDLAARLCARPDVDPVQVIYVPCDSMAARDLRRTFTLGRALTQVIDRGGVRRRVWLLDEVSAVESWTSIVKLARDGTEVGDDTVVVTGSRWREGEYVERNLLAGRAGSSGVRRVRHLLPMSFRQFLATTRRELPRPGPVHPAELQGAATRAELEAVGFELDELDLAWQDFLTCGGFPRAVAEHVRTGAVSDDYLRDLAAWLRDDAQLDGPSESMSLFMSEITSRTSSPLNVVGLADALGWTRSVTDARLQRLVTSLAAVWCRQRDDAGRIVPRAQSKLYLIDPVLAWLPGRLRAGLGSPDMTTLTEQALGVALARSIDGLNEGRLAAGDSIGYAKTGSGNEVDFAPVPVPAAAGDRPTVPIEAKWVDARWRSEAKTIENKYGHGVVATKSVLDLRHPVWAIPAPLTALLLG